MCVHVYPVLGRYQIRGQRGGEGEHKEGLVKEAGASLACWQPGGNN